VLEQTRRYGAIPKLGEHTDTIRAEFLNTISEGERP